MKHIILERFEASTASALHEADPSTIDAEAAEAIAAAEAQALALEEAAAERMHREQAIASELARVAHAVAQSRKGAIDAVVEDVSAALMEALPEIVKAHFSQELAAASTRIIDQSGIATATLRVCPDDEAIILDVLKSSPPRHEMTVVSDHTLGAGQARVDWAGGGAVFDAAQWAQEVRELLKVYLETRRNEGTEK